MTGRATSDLLLVGSLPADSTEDALRSGGALFGDLVFALPDGETGPRAAWVGYERERLVRPHPDVETVEVTESPTGIPRHAYETPVFADPRRRRRPALGHLAAHRRRDRLLPDVPRAARRRRDPPRPALPDRPAVPVERAQRASRPTSPATTRSRPAGFEDLVARELDAAARRDPGRRTSRSSGTSATRSSTSRASSRGWATAPGSGSPARSTRLTRLIPEDVLVGYHLCYGTFPEWPMYEARDIGLLVRMANHAVAHSGRTVDWVHMAGPRYLRSEDERFFAPLRDLDGRRHARLPRASSCRSTGSRACGGGTRRRRSSSTTSASRCTAASAASPGATGRRRCASTATSSRRCAADRRRRPRPFSRAMT